jgi:hypothetical protein
MSKGFHSRVLDGRTDGHKRGHTPRAYPGHRRPARIICDGT